MTKHERQRCPVCGVKYPLYDQGWRALDMGRKFWSSPNDADVGAKEEHPTCVGQWRRLDQRHCHRAVPAVFCIAPFHAVSWVTDVLDQLRRQQWSTARNQLASENKGKPTAKRGRPKGGSIPKSKAQNKRLATAYRLKENLRLLLRLQPDDVRPDLMKWRCQAWSSRNNLLIDLQRKIKRHTESMIAAVSYGLSNARIEATNHKIKLSIYRASDFATLTISSPWFCCAAAVFRLPSTTGLHEYPLILGLSHFFILFQPTLPAQGRDCWQH